MIPIGTRHHVTVHRTVEVPFHCKFCRFKTVAHVRSEGLGESAAPLFIGEKKAIARAERGAQTDLIASAEALADNATCPACGRFDAAGRRLTHALGLVAPIGLTLAGIGVDVYLRPSWPLVTVLAAAGAAWIYWTTRWRWTQTDQRVEFPRNP